MKLNFSGTQIFALFLIVVMIGSIGVLLVYSVTNNPDSGPDTPDTPIGTDSESQLSYTAESSATVVQSLPQVIAAAPTSQTDIQKIESQVVAIPGILLQNFKSYYKTDPQSGQLVYIAEFSFDNKQTTLAAVQEAVSGISDFSGPVDLMATALVSVPKTIRFHNPDFDLNRDFSLPDPLISSYVSPQTMVNDEITVNISAVFTGNKLDQIVAYESSNPQTAALTREAVRLHPIRELKPILFVSADVNYSTAFEPDAAQAKLLSLTDLNSVQTKYQPLGDPLVHFYSDSNQLAADVNAIFSDQDNLQSFSIQADETGFLVQFKPKSSADFPGIKNDLTQKFASKGWTEPVDFQFASYSIRFQANLSATTTDLNYAATQVRKLLSLPPSTVIYQSAVIDLPFIEESITNPDSVKYSFDQNQLDVLVFPNHKTSEPVVIDFKFVTQRNTIVQILSAVEPPGESSQPGNPGENPFLQ